MFRAITSTSFATFVVIALAMAGSSSAQQTTAHSSSSAIQEMMNLTMPSEGHRFFAPMAGKWRGKMKVWDYTTPSKPPMESDAESESKPILGGRFLLEEAGSSFMGMPMKRMSILGYDNITKQYTLIFYSSMETATNIATGTLDANGKVLTLRGEFNVPAGKEAFKNVIRVDADIHTFESYRIMPDGTEHKAVEQIMTRVK